MKSLRHRLEFAVVWLFYTLCRLLPWRAASALGGGTGWLLATLPAPFNTTARENLRRAFPQKSEADIRRLQQAALVNFGRTMAEFPKAYRLTRQALEQRVTVDGLSHALTHQPALLLTGHIGNWDVLAQYMAQQGIPCGSVYRAANNPFVNDLMVRTRALSGVSQVPKGAHGARQLLKLIAEGRSLGMLVDQKMNDGIAAPFFGRPAMTAPALAELALKKNLPVLPAFCWRERGGTYRVEVGAPLTLTRTGDHTADVAANTALFNQVLEAAIRRAPEQWLWFHRRWPKD